MAQEAAAAAGGCPVRGGGGAAAAPPATSGCPVRGVGGGSPPAVDPGNKMLAGGERNLPAPDQRRPLDTARQTSTIPKGEYTPDHQSGASQTWEYPSPQMFFNAMRRKGYQPSEGDMGTVVAIHNAVNERAWTEVLRWEAMHRGSCGNPTLLRFEGRPKDISPRAWARSWMGYALPFDRHDWVVDRSAPPARARPPPRARSWLPDARCARSLAAARR